MNQQEIRQGKLVYFEEWPPEVLEAVREILDPLAWLVPAWCNEIYVHWNNKNTCAIDCSINYDYRRAVLTFRPPFLMGDADYRRRMVIHDLLHCFSAVLADYAADTIETLLPKDEADKFRQHALRELNMRHEQWVEDLAFCLSQKL